MTGMFFREDETKIEMSSAVADALGILYAKNAILSLNAYDREASGPGLRMTFLGNAPKKLKVRQYNP
jgi:hypothetical protein